MTLQSLDFNNRLLDQVIDAYDHHYDSEGSLRETDSFYRWVLEKLAATSGSLLDIACGEGHLLRIAQKFGLRGLGIDFSKSAAKTAAKVVNASIISVADAEQLPFASQSFDYATNLGSLEHFFDPNIGLQEMRRVLKPGGRAALVLPNSYYWLDVVWHVWRRGFPVSHRQVIERFATAGQWQQIIESNGFQVQIVHKYNLCFPTTLADWYWYSHRPRQLVYPLLSPITPHNLSYSFLFICSPC